MDQGNRFCPGAQRNPEVGRKTKEYRETVHRVTNKNTNKQTNSKQRESLTFEVLPFKRKSDDMKVKAYVSFTIYLRQLVYL